MSAFQELNLATTSLNDATTTRYSKCGNPRLPHSFSWTGVAVGLAVGVVVGVGVGGGVGVGVGVEIGVGVKLGEGVGDE